MIDIHCHILPNLDDGPKEISQSIDMARQAAEDGIRTIVATPHIKPPFLPPERILFSLSILNSRLAALGVPITILAGGDVNALLLPPAPGRYVLHKGPYMLLEFPHSHLPSNAREILFGLCARGLVPVITHPERNAGILRNPGRFLDLLDSNIMVQLTAGSLTGYFGRDVAECARFLLRKGVVNFLATDAHATAYRRPILSAGLAVAERVVGKLAARKLVSDNPAAVVAGERI